MESGEQKIILVTRRTRLEELVRRHNTVEQAKFQAEHLGMDFGDFMEEDRVYQRAIKTVEESLSVHGRLQRLDRGFLPNFLFPPQCLVVVLGQDGLVANTLKYLDGQSVMAINPDPARWEGVLLPFAVGDVTTVIREALRGKRETREVTMARARLSDGQELLAVNDFFVGARSHVSARYKISLGDRSETHSSSGVIISTGLGSTGWLRSVLTGAAGIAGESSSEVVALREQGMSWSSDQLVFAVREPYPSRSTQASLVFGRCGVGAPLRIRSLMAEGGTLFSDGIEADGLDFRAGLEALIDTSPSHGRLLN